MKIKIKKTQRGFGRCEFKDIDGESCSIQDSSLADSPALWLGKDEGTHHMGSCMARMHINVSIAKELIRILEDFVSRGRIVH